MDEEPDIWEQLFEGFNEWDIILSFAGALTGAIAMLTGQVWLALLVKAIIFYLMFAPWVPLIVFLALIYFGLWSIE